MKRLTITVFLILIIQLFVRGNASKDSINLIPYGNFEMGNTKFSSDFEFNSHFVKPGEYSITKNASLLNPDFKNPKYGDHTSGNGWFMVVNSNDENGLMAWRTRVKVIPNSVYHFSLYFCNIYKTQNSNFGLAVNGMAPETSPIGNDPNIKVTINREVVLEDERDIFHTFGWLRTEVDWYSGTAYGEIEITISNKNSKSLGNDLALDDISFYYVKTMPPDYKPPINRTAMSEEFMEEERLKHQIDPKKFLVTNDLGKGDSIAPGIYAITRNPKKTEPIDLVLKFPSILFDQGKSDLTFLAVRQLDTLAKYLNKYPTLKIQLKGHTENLGNVDLNNKLSEERAIQVKNYLIYKGVGAKRIETVGYGGSHPIENHSNEEYRRLNRRVEIEIIR